jgi:pyruvate/2-oxoglutarate dehydrogenase complex dihydrolipoamide dehydrogenase (E3) component
MNIEGLVPGNVFDEELRAKVAPEDWINPRPKEKYHLVVMGAGTAGLVAAAGAAGLGAKVALIEKNLMGGDCLNSGCVPSKALLAAAHAAQRARSLSHLGAEAREVRVDFPAVMDRMRKLRAGIAKHDSAARFRDLGVDVFRGSGCFIASDKIEVDGVQLRFRRALIATGARASVPPIPGLKEAGFLTNETLFALTELPKRLIVLGGGPIGCEMAQAFRRFGSEVTLVDRGRLLPKDEPEAAEYVQRSLEADGIELLLQSEPIDVRHASGTRVMRVKTPVGERELRADAILVAAGRALNLENLNLQAAGIAMDGKKLKLDARLRTTNARVYASGDIAGGYQFTHAADAHSRLVLRNAFFLGRNKVDDLLMPWCTYTDPEVAQVGLTRALAESKGLETEALKIVFSELDRGMLEGEEGFLQALVLKGSDRVVGFTAVGSHAGDFMGEAALLLKTSARLGTLSSLIHPYPTLGEAFKRLGDMSQRARLTPLAKRFFEMWFKLFS